MVAGPVGDSLPTWYGEQGGESGDPEGPEIIDEGGRTPLGTAPLTRHGCHQTIAQSSLLERFTCD